jgi:fructose-1-phosphate kinase PfkB-like protein
MGRRRWEARATLEGGGVGAVGAVVAGFLAHVAEVSGLVGAASHGVAAAVAAVADHARAAPGADDVTGTHPREVSFAPAAIAERIR